MYKSTPLRKFLQNKPTKTQLDKLFITTKHFMLADSVEEDHIYYKRNNIKRKYFNTNCEYILTKNEHRRYKGSEMIPYMFLAYDLLKDLKIVK